MPLFLVPYAKSAELANGTSIPVSPRNPNWSWQRLRSRIDVDWNAPSQQLVRDVTNSEGGYVTIVNSLAPRCVKLLRHSGLRHKRGTDPTFLIT
jgi:hypothetical protein